MAADVGHCAALMQSTQPSVGSHCCFAGQAWAPQVTVPAAEPPSAALVAPASAAPLSPVAVPVLDALSGFAVPPSLAPPSLIAAVPPSVPLPPSYSTWLASPSLPGAWPVPARLMLPQAVRRQLPAANAQAIGAASACVSLIALSFAGGAVLISCRRARKGLSRARAPGRIGDDAADEGIPRWILPTHARSSASASARGRGWSLELPCAWPKVVTRLATPA
jgi:hypothetical protein